MISNVKKQISIEEQKFKEGVKAKLLALSIQLSYPQHVTEIVLEDIKESLRGHAPYFLPKLRVEGEELRSGAYILAKLESEEAKKETLTILRKFVTKEEKLKENREKCGKIVELESKYYTLNRSVEIDLESLIMQVENGTSLKGSCEMCPKIKIVGSRELDAVTTKKVSS